jgi:hypothetical protein
MVPSSLITIITDGEHLMCGGFSLGETVRLGNFEFIADYFGGLSFSLRRGDAAAAFIGSTHSGASAPWRAITRDSTDEFLMAPSMEGSFSFPSPRRRGKGASVIPHSEIAGTKPPYVCQDVSFTRIVTI